MTEPDPPVAATDPGRRREDRRAALSAVFAFSFALGIGALALPLLAVSAGYDAATIGLLAATSASSQFLVRLRLPALLAVYPDRTLIIVACLALATSYGLLLASTLLPVFVVAELLQGSSRALFWTASQTHAVRSRGTAVQSLSMVVGTGNVGQMLGPLATGFLAGYTLRAPLLLAGLCAVAGGLMASRLVGYPPYDRRGARQGARLWLRTGVDSACWAGFAGGGWRALMSSFVPLVLTGAGQTPGTTGVLMSMADLAGMTAVFAMTRLHVKRVERTLALAVALACGSLALVPAAAAYALAAGIILAAGGAGAASINALAAAAARQRVEARYEGEVIALVGTFRAGALLVAPTGVAAIVGALTLAPAVSLASLLLGVPIVLVGAARHLVGSERATP